MIALSSKINTPISDQELQRRWTAVRSAMKQQGIDVLLMQNNNDHMGGYVKYFTDLPAANGYPVTVVFPKDDGITLVRQGPFGGDQRVPPEGDGVLRGVTRVLTSPSFASAPFTKHYDAELASRALEPYVNQTVGLVGTAQMPFALVDYLKKNRFSKTEFVDASQMVDGIKVLKSEEELALIRMTAAMQDQAMAAAFAAVRPGRKDSDIAAVAQHVGQELGSEQGIYLCASAPPGTPCMFGPRHYQNRTIQKGDQFVLLIENNGPGGFYTELGRTCVLGKVDRKLQDEFAFTLHAQQFAVDLLQPGASCADVWDAYNAFMRKNGRPEEQRLFCHGQGYDLVERPLVRHDESMRIEKNMNIVVHPTYVKGDLMSWVCDNYIIGSDGRVRRIHEYPQEILAL
ncbi:MAG: M24 family metallopeptidase [Desulfobacterales bacterium]|nr:M24 family metallopeptidase [Desulfobacterales bacterium]